MSKYSSDSSGTTNERKVSNKTHIRKSEAIAKHKTQERTENLANYYRENLATHHRQPFQMQDRLTTTTGAKSRRFNEECPPDGTPVTKSNTSQVTGTFYYKHFLF